MVGPRLHCSLHEVPVLGGFRLNGVPFLLSLDVHLLELPLADVLMNHAVVEMVTTPTLIADPGQLAIHDLRRGRRAGIGAEEENRVVLVRLGARAATSTATSCNAMLLCLHLIASHNASRQSGACHTSVVELLRESCHARLDVLVMGKGEEAANCVAAPSEDNCLVTRRKEGQPGRLTHASLSERRRHRAVVKQGMSNAAIGVGTHTGHLTLLDHGAHHGDAANRSVACVSHRQRKTRRRARRRRRRC